MEPAKLKRLFAIAAVVLLAWLPCSVAEEVRIGVVYAAEKGLALERDGEDKNGNYRKALEAQGATVVVLSQHEARDTVRERFRGIDGVLLPGGIDVDPKYYGEAPHAKLGEHDADLDALEFEALDYAKEHELPVLGVCRGHQVLNVYYGGSLYQDIPSQYDAETQVVHRFDKESKARREHAISIEPDSLLRDLLKTERITVTTYHHQAVKELAPGFVVTARSDDGIVEAMEWTGERFVLGVQFHPEKALEEEPRMNALFERFVQEARQVPHRRARKRARKGAPE